jgi:predicted GNAT family acetyltransferase
MALLHTEVQEGFEGQGIGARLVHRVFDDVRSRGLAIIPRCPFVVRWLEHHPEQHDLLSHPLPPPEPGPSDEPPKLA